MLFTIMAAFAQGCEDCALAFLLAIAIGIPLGIISALRRNTLADYTAMGLAVFGVSVPVIILAPILQYLLGVELKWLPVSGWGAPRQAVLPAFALFLLMFAFNFLGDGLRDALDPTLGGRV